MTNAEKLAKDIEQLSDIINGITSSCDYCIYNHGDACDAIPSSNGCCFEGVQKWLESEAEEELAIWRYDNFPYMKIGKVKYKNADGTVEVKGYDGMRFKPIKIIPYAETLISKFSVILEEHRKAEKEADERTLCNLKALLGIESEVEEDAEIH